MPDAAQLYSDEPVLFDELGRTNMVCRLAKDIATCNPPQVFGVFGDWGSGKTSFLHQLQWRLTGECPQRIQEVTKEEKKKIEAQLKSAEAQPQDAQAPASANRETKTDHIVVVWFEAWRYQHEPVPIVALLQEVRKQFSLRSEAKRRRSKTAEVAIRGGLSSIESITKKFGIRPSKFQEAREKWEQEHLEVPLPSHVIRMQLEDTIRELLKNILGKNKPNVRVAILIDDLDRCEPAPTYGLLEGIKVFLSLPSCIFVLALNQRAVEDAVADRLPNVPNKKQYAREYVEKLCSTVYHLPHREPSGLLAGLLESSPLDARLREQLVALVKEHRALPANPRKIKAYANVVARFAEHLNGIVPATAPGTTAAGGGAQPNHAAAIVVMTYIYHFHPRIYELVESDPKYFLLLQRWADNPSSATDPLLVELKPHRETTTEGSTYFDPMEHEVFWASSLLRSQTLGTLTEDDLARYLLKY